MRGFGVMLLLLGVGSYVLPLVGMPIGIRFVPPEYRLHASVVASVAGAVLVLLSFRGGKKDKK
jgi:hypothetical protein